MHISRDRLIRILLSLLLLTLSALPALAVDGLQTGANVTFRKGNNTFTGRLMAVSLDREPATVVTLSGKAEKFWLRNVSRITATGEKKLITPSWSSVANTYAIYRFETLDGKVVEGGVYKWPIFTVDTGGGEIMNNLWLDRLTYIETVGAKITSGSGFTVGNKVRYIVKGQPITSGTIATVSMNPASEPLTLATPSASSVKLLLKDITKVRPTGQKKQLIPPWSSAEETLELYEFTTTAGLKMIGAVQQWPLFTVASGQKEEKRDLRLEQLELLEAD